MKIYNYFNEQCVDYDYDSRNDTSIIPPSDYEWLKMIILVILLFWGWLAVLFFGGLNFFRLLNAELIHFHRCFKQISLD